MLYLNRIRSPGIDKRHIRSIRTTSTTSELELRRPLAPSDLISGPNLHAIQPSGREAIHHRLTLTTSIYNLSIAILTCRCRHRTIAASASLCGRCHHIVVLVIGRVAVDEPQLVLDDLRAAVGLGRVPFEHGRVRFRLRHQFWRRAWAWRYCCACELRWRIARRRCTDCVMC